MIGTNCSSVLIRHWALSRVVSNETWVDSGLDSVRRAISASFGRRPRFGLPTQVQRDVAETLSVVGTKLLSFYRDDPFERGVGNIV